MLVFDTICALATPKAKSALALVRLSGEKSFETLSHMIHKDVKDLEANHAYFVRLYKDKNDPSTFLDEAVIVVYKGPRSYTGFDSVDFSLHGSPLIVDNVLDALVAVGARRAERGEFSAQAYYNGKMDLLKAEGINDLINATSKRALEIASKTLSNENSKIVTALKNDLLSDLATLEYYVENEYAEEESDGYDKDSVKVEEDLEKQSSELDNLIHKAKRANREYNGFNVAIAGEPNVGKSTLLNALLGEDKAIVSPIPGTTRDVVEGEKEIDGHLFRFKDTAGLRKTDDVVENLGIQRSYETMKKADLIVLASDCGFDDIDKNKEVQEILKEKPYIKVATKRDLNGEQKGADISICSTKDDLTPLVSLMKKKLDLEGKEESLFLGKREEDYLIAIKEQVDKAAFALKETKLIDISSDTLREAISLINDLMGNSEGETMEDIYQTLFSKFCLGK